MLRLFGFVLFAQLLFPFLVWGQRTEKACSAQKIAFYNELVFEDENGVERLYRAYLALEKTRNGYPAPNVSPADRQKAYEYRKGVIVEPVLRGINFSIENFKVAQDFQLFEGTKMDEKGLILAFVKRFDVSDQLIKYLNQTPDEQRSIPKLNVEQSRVGKVNTSRFFDTNNGIKGFPSRSGGLDSFCHTDAKCDEIYKYLNEYATTRGFSVIFDSSKELEPAIEKLACDDETERFITAFNRHLSERDN